MKNLVLTGLLVLAPSLTMAQHTGKVFVDANDNGIWDKGEKLLKDIVVSDGLNVTRTDGKGDFSLPGHSKERFIFITTPSGYKTNNSYYQRIEEGAQSYDFALRPYRGGIKSDGTHKFIHISDTEIGEKEGHDDWVGNLRDYAANEGVAFIMHTGDICYRPGLDSHIRIMNTGNMIDTQVFYSVGNHDLVSGKYGEEHFEELYGPSFYSFDSGNVHYIVTPMFGGDYWPSYRKKDVYQWIKNDLKYVPKSKSIIVFNHSIADDTESFKLNISDTEFVDLQAHNLKAWFYGHWHVNHIHKHEKTGVYSICSSTPIRGGIDHAASAFRVLTVDPKGEFTSSFRYCYIDKSLQIASIQNMQAPSLASGAVPLSVNAYSTVSPVVSVRYSCFHEGKKIVAGQPLKQETDFNWYAEMALPGAMDYKFVTVVVEAQFLNGEIAKKEASFVYNKKGAETIELGKDWTNLLSSPAHIGVVADTLESPLQLAWVKNVGSNIYMASPLVYKNAVYVASVDDNESGKASVVSMDAVSGNIRWKCPVRASVRSSIAITSGLVFAQDVHGMLYAIDADKGTLVWEKDLNIGMVPPLNDGLIATEGVVYAGTGKSLCALKAETGEQIWRNNDWNRGEGCTATLSVNNNVLIGHAHWGGLYANDAKTGKMLWGTGDGELRHRSSSAAMWNDIFYILSSESLFVIESKTGRILVRKKLNYNVNVTSTPLVTDTEIIFGTSDRGVIALDKETLVEKWNFKAKPALVYTAPYVRNPAATVETSPVLVGNTVYFGASDGTLYAVDCKKGNLKWKHETAAPIFATVSVSGNALYAVDFSGNVYGFVSELKTAGNR
ncbi:outer membrane protein assembly factor BamB family protein [Phocaeicola sp.]